MKKGLLLVSMLFLSVVFIWAGASHEESGITEPITMYVDVAVGGARDVRARVIAEYLSEELGVPVNIENITGAGGITCATHVLTSSNSPNDLFFGPMSAFTSSTVFTETMYSIDDYRPLVAVDAENFGLFTCPSRGGISSMDDLKEYAKDHEVIYGSGGVGNVTHLYQAGLYKTLGFPKANTLAHNGAVIGITNCMGGHNVVTMAGLETARGYVENGDIVPIMVFDLEPYTGYEGFTVPSVLDIGGNEMLEYTGLMFISCLATVSDENAQILQNALDKVIHDPECVEDLKAVGVVEMAYMTPDEILNRVAMERDATIKILDMISE